MQTFGRRPSTAASALSSSRPDPMGPYYTHSPASSCSSSSSSLSSSSSSSSALQNFKSSLRRGVLTRDLSIDDLIVPKNRRPRFDLFIQIHDLNNVPLVSGQAYVKWHVEGSASGRTTKENIKDHKVSWQYSHVCQNLRMTVGRDGMLQDLLIYFEINQEYSGARERIMLGTVSLNLAEYASVKKETRRYLMQESKINSTLQVTIALTQTGGDTNYVAPMLRGAQVFSGIAGIMTSEPREQEDPAKKMASLTSQAREIDALQDMYRRTLAASWQLQSGELNAEECIEDIFAGGDGWTSRSERRKAKSDNSSTRDGSDSESLSAASTGGRSEIILNVPTIVGGREGRRKKDADAISVMSVATTMQPRKVSRRSGGGNGSWREVDELQARDALVSWRILSTATWG
ncbi:hypothetical protein RUND412_010853 [Rhizina undulata]